jgi:protein phosphatase
MGASVAMAWLRGNAAYLAHMGDSRIYLYRGAKLARMTEDHSVVALLLKHGEITAADAPNHPMRGKLSRFVGMDESVYPDVKTIDLRIADRLLLCSAGLTGLVADERIASILANHRDPQAAREALVAEVNAAGGIDNTTVIVVNVNGVRS